MVIVKISGGLGNQMYQYALYRKYISMGVEAKISISYYENTEILNVVPQHSVKFLLEEVFSGIVANIASDAEIQKYETFSSNPVLRFLARKGLFRKIVIEDVKNEEAIFHPEILKLRDGFVDGYWQSIKYIADILPLLRKEFSFAKPLMGKNKDVSEYISTSNSVSIHVRRGDYLNTEYEQLDMAYYSKAISFVKKKIKDPVFFIFSDDINWCKENLEIEGTYINWNKGKDSYVDMQLMSLCKANIVANSTFSIWAALLNNNSPIVIHPYKYTKSGPQKIDRWPEKWIEIKY